jgi:hypothetical protein
VLAYSTRDVIILHTAGFGGARREKGCTAC